MTPISLKACDHGIYVKFRLATKHLGSKQMCDYYNGPEATRSMDLSADNTRKHGELVKATIYLQRVKEATM